MPTTEKITTRVIIEILPDENAESPREWDNFGTMACEHGHYNLGECKVSESDLFDEDLHPTAEAQKTHLFFPLYLYDHSGLRMKIGSFNGLLPQGHAELDSGQVGYIFVSIEDAKKEYRGDWKTKAEEQLKAEVKAYDQFLSGDIWGFRVKKIETTDDGFVRETELDSCWGFYGQDDAEIAAKECLSAGDAAIAEIIKN